MGEDVTVQLTGSESRSETGLLGKTVTVQLTGNLVRAETGRLSWTSLREYCEKHTFPPVFVMLLTLGFPFLGLFLAGWIGIAVGSIVSIVNYGGGLVAVTRVREINRSQ